MKLKEIYDHLSYGELSQVNLGGANLGEIAEINYPRMAAHVFLGLTELHKRFLIRQGEVEITVVPGQRTYHLDWQYALENEYSLVDEEDRYITSADQLEGANVFKIEQVFDAEGTELTLDDPSDEDAVKRLGYRTLMLPESMVEEPLTSETVTVVYRCNHPVFNENQVDDPETAEVDLPYVFLEALLYYVASRCLNPTGFASGNGFHEGNNYMAKFEQACAVLEAQNYQLEKQVKNERLYTNGWP